MSYTLKYTGAEIDDILDRAVEGGAIDEELALKAPLESPALTGTPTAPTPAESDNSTKVATTAYAERAAAGAAAAAYPVDTANGSVASFSDGADGVPVKSLVVDIDYNASGWTGANVYRAGVNLFNVADAFNGTGQSVSGTTITKAYSGYSFDLLNGTTGASSLATKKIFLPAGTYVISGTYTGAGSLRVYTCDADGEVASTHIAAITSSIAYQSFTLAESSYITLRYGNRDACTVDKIQIEIGDQATTYAGYDGATYVISWSDTAGTIYGGTVDVTNGVLTSTKAADGSDITPVEYSISKTAIPTALGVNNLWANTGDVVVEYRADIALYVQKLLGGNVNTLSMSAPTPSLSLGRTGVLLEPEAMEPVITEDAEPDLAEEEPEEPEAEEE